jgi:hypothetical protein
MTTATGSKMQPVATCDPLQPATRSEMRHKRSCLSTYSYLTPYIPLESKAAPRPSLGTHFRLFSPRGIGKAILWTSKTNNKSNPKTVPRRGKRTSVAKQTRRRGRAGETAGGNNNNVNTVNQERWCGLE